MVDKSDTPEDMCSFTLYSSLYHLIQVSLSLDFKDSSATKKCSYP